MKNLGIVREIDHLGRVCLPAEMRKVFGWVDGTKLQFLATEDSLIIQGFEHQCVACKDGKDLVNVGSVKVCKKCLEEAKTVV